ncbi:MAG: hypothetical protein HZB13_00290, partial [Acidobacteria bacterium]|nr:hypothetical protein [Acidobacteriota bacterium]
MNVRQAALLTLFTAAALRAQDAARWQVIYYGETGTGVRKAECGPRARASGDILVGQAAGRRVIQSVGEPVEDGAFVKRLWVERSADEFCLLFEEKWPRNMVERGPVEIYALSGETVLATRDRMSGTGANYVEAYWVFDDGGPVLLDQSVILSALKEVLPKGLGVWKGYGLDMKNLCFRMPVWRDGDANCCPSGGSVALQI